MLLKVSTSILSIFCQLRGIFLEGCFCRCFPFNICCNIWEHILLFVLYNMRVDFWIKYQHNDFQGHKKNEYAHTCISSIEAILQGLDL